MEKWGDIIIETLRKMFLNDGVLLIEKIEEYKKDDTYSIYIDGMASTYNEGLLLITNNNKHIVKSVELENINTLNEYIEYDLKTVIPDYAKLVKIIDIQSGYKMSNDFVLLNPNKLLIKNNKRKHMMIYYAYPKLVKKETLVNEALDVPIEISSILPLYMASELYKDDDNSLATSYRNEFEVARQELIDDTSVNIEEFENTKGWY